LGRDRGKALNPKKPRDSKEGGYSLKGGRAGNCCEGVRSAAARKRETKASVPKGGRDFPSGAEEFGHLPETLKKSRTCPGGKRKKT